MTKPVGKFEKVSLFALVDDNGELKVPVTYSKGLGSYALLSSHRVAENRENIPLDLVAFAEHPSIGLKEITARYLAKGVSVHRLGEDRAKAFVEPRGEVKGVVQDCHFKYYETDRPLKPEDFKERVRFIPYSEIAKHAQNYKGHSPLKLEIDGKDALIDIGVVQAVKKHKKEQNKLKGHVFALVFFL